MEAKANIAANGQWPMVLMRGKKGVGICSKCYTLLYASRCTMLYSISFLTAAYIYLHLSGQWTSKQQRRSE